MVAAGSRRCHGPALDSAGGKAATLALSRLPLTASKSSSRDTTSPLLAASWAHTIL
jgi:hypothetical protein